MFAIRCYGGPHRAVGACHARVPRHNRLGACAGHRRSLLKTRSPRFSGSDAIEGASPGHARRALRACAMEDGPKHMNVKRFLVALAALLVLAAPAAFAATAATSGA